MEESKRAKRRRQFEALWQRLYDREVHRSNFRADRSLWDVWISKSVNNPASCDSRCCSHKKRKAWSKGAGRYGRREWASRLDFEELKKDVDR